MSPDVCRCLQMPASLLPCCKTRLRPWPEYVRLHSRTLCWAASASVLLHQRCLVPRNITQTGNSPPGVILYVTPGHIDQGTNPNLPPPPLHAQLGTVWPSCLLPPAVPAHHSRSLRLARPLADTHTYIYTPHTTHHTPHTPLPLALQIAPSSHTSNRPWPHHEVHSSKGSHLLLSPAEDLRVRSLRSLRSPVPPDRFDDPSRTSRTSRTQPPFSPRDPAEHLLRIISAGGTRPEGEDCHLAALHRPLDYLGWLGTPPHLRSTASPPSSPSRGTVDSFVRSIDLVIGIVPVTPVRLKVGLGLRPETPPALLCATPPATPSASPISWITPILAAHPFLPLTVHSSPVPFPPQHRPTSIYKHHAGAATSPARVLLPQGQRGPSR
jgi:hypothetical protein